MVAKSATYSMTDTLPRFQLIRKFNFMVNRYHAMSSKDEVLTRGKSKLGGKRWAPLLGKLCQFFLFFSLVWIRWGRGEILELNFNFQLKKCHFDCFSSNLGPSSRFICKESRKSCLDEIPSHNRPCRRVNLFSRIYRRKLK